VTLPADAASDRAQSRRGASAVVVGLAGVGLGGFVIQQALSGGYEPSYATVGPGVFPFVVGVGLVLVGLGLVAQALLGSGRVTWIEAGGTGATDAPSPLARLLLIGAALVLDVALMQPAGFVLASTVLFVCVTRAFGSRRLVLDAALGLAFTGAIYVIFTRGLKLLLPAGQIWENVWESIAWIF
jgi:putative tricarboxylic transport membrane protein